MSQAEAAQEFALFSHPPRSQFHQESSLYLGLGRQVSSYATNVAAELLFGLESGLLNYSGPKEPGAKARQLWLPTCQPNVFQPRPAQMEQDVIQPQVLKVQRLFP